MHNRLIFRYRRARANADLELLRGCSSERTDPLEGRKRRGDAEG
jgi:hypothetical protein